MLQVLKLASLADATLSNTLRVPDQVPRPASELQDRARMA